jgi:hypothetical protein
LSRIEAPVTASSDRRGCLLPSGPKSPPTKTPVEVVDATERTQLPDATEVDLVWGEPTVAGVRSVAVVPEPKVRAVPVDLRGTREEPDAPRHRLFECPKDPLNASVGPRVRRSDERMPHDVGRAQRRENPRREDRASPRVRRSE